MNKTRGAGKRLHLAIAIQLLGTALGLALTGLFVARVHIGTLEQTVNDAGYGIALLIVLHFVSVAVDSQAWYTILRRLRAHIGRGLVIWMACLRNSVQTLVPIGASGFVSGYRSLRRHEIPAHSALSSLIFETTVTTAAEFFLLVLSAGILFEESSPTESRSFLAYAPLVGILACILAVALVLQLRGKVFDTMSRALERFRSDVGRLARSRFPLHVKHGLWRLYRSPAVSARSFLWQLTSLLVGAASVWLAFSLIRERVPFVDAVFFLSLARALRSFGFLIPSAWGLQEGFFILFAPLAGVTPTAGLAVSLILRVRDFAFAFAVVAVGRIVRLRFRPEGARHPPLSQTACRSLADD